MMFTSSVETIIELDGSMYRYSGHQLEPIDGIAAVKGDKVLITDLQDAICRTMTVSATPRYAEVIVRKRIQETGEFEENVAVLCHWKKKKDANTTDICFTALPLRMLSHYQDLSRESEDILLVLPLYSVLLNTLRRIRPAEPVALIFQHDRFADLMIGNKRQVLYSNRCVAFDASSDQLAALWNTIEADIRTVEQEHHIRIDKQFLLTWLGGDRPPVDTSDTQRETFYLEDDSIHLEGQRQHQSFTRAVNMAGVRHSVSQPMEKICFYARRAVPFFNILLLLGVLILTGAHFYLRDQSARLEQTLRRLEGAVTSLQFDIPKDVDQKEVEETLRFISELSINARTPSFKRIINDVSHSIIGNISVEVLKVDVETDRVNMELYGRVNAPFKTAYQGYQKLIQGLEQRGYAVQQNQFDTDINTSRFLLRIDKRIQ